MDRSKYPEEREGNRKKIIVTNSENRAVREWNNKKTTELMFWQIGQQEKDFPLGKTIVKNRCIRGTRGNKEGEIK